MSAFQNVLHFLGHYLTPNSKGNLRKNYRTELILTKYYPFYLKLTTQSKLLFIDRLEYVFPCLNIEFKSENDYDNFKYQLLIAAEITHYVIGIKGYKVRPFPLMKIDVDTPKERSVLGADVEDDMFVIYWEKFFDEIIKGEETGLIRLMVDRIFRLNFEAIDTTLKEAFLNVRHVNSERRTCFNIYDVKDNQSFYKACFRLYFLHPEELRNVHPKIYRKVDHVLFYDV
ncbi:hypothetical protein OAH12_02330 [Cyclobacteriaceae bacterium]|nr:hypothetical protein [Cyclobacteriaceae bacterium]